MTGLFRGQTENGEWVVGSLVCLKSGSCYIVTGIHGLYTFAKENLSCNFTHKVSPESLAAFTGRFDDKGKPIYGSFKVDGKMSRGGDRLITSNPALANKDDILSVKYVGSAFYIYNPSCCNKCTDEDGCIGLFDEWPDGFEVIQMEAK